MNFITGQSNFLQALGWAVFHSLWQMALLWIIYQFITTFTRIKSPSTKASYASLLAFAGFAWFIYTFIFILNTGVPGDAIVFAGIINSEPISPLNQWLKQALPFASLLYLILLLLPLFQFIRNYRFVQLIRYTGLSKANVEWRMFINKVAEQMGIHKPVHIWISSLVSSPVTIGYIKPVILVPLAAVNHLTTQQLEAVLLHELAHIRRYDYFINLILKFIQTILYFNPFVKAFVKIVEREREKSCDEMVMQYQYEPYGYASALLALEKINQLPESFAVAANGKKSDLLHRIEWILGIEKNSVFSFNKMAGLFAGLLCIIALNAVIGLNRIVIKDNKISSAFLPASSSNSFTENNNKASEEKIIASSKKELPEAKDETLIKERVTNSSAEITSSLSPEEELHTLLNPFAVAAASIASADIPVLKQYQEEQVQKAIAASKKVIQEGQWKAIEKNIAEVLTQQQKEELKAEYLKEMSKLDLEKWEENLRLAYNNVDWEKVNVQLNNAVVNIRLDSLQHVYVKALDHLAMMQTELKENNLIAIPDTDITLQQVEQKKSELKKELNKIKAVRNKKIVRL